ncbi:MAG: hypothetical protein M3342_02920 [Bacteroidota bacterium]|nr:hypothetical protein [Bacteroidota bacterium]
MHTIVHLKTKKKTLTVTLNDSEYGKLGLPTDNVPFDALKEKISIEYAREAFFKCNQIAKQTGLSRLTLDEINTEINAARNAKNHT